MQTRVLLWTMFAALALTPLAPGAEPRSGVLQPPNAEQVRRQADVWLRQAGRTDAASQQAFQKIWDGADRVLDRLADTFALGDVEAARLLVEVRDPGSAAPRQTPNLFQDDSRSRFFRANLALIYARELSRRRDHERSLDVLRTTSARDVADPAAWFFHKAVAEFALLHKDEAQRSITRLLEEVADPPDRYRLLALLMQQEMRSWKERDLGEVARLMDVVEQRLGLARGGPRTQEIQREIVHKLDELIKEREEHGPHTPLPDPPQPGPGPREPGPDHCPIAKPLPDSVLPPGPHGRGQVDRIPLEQLARQWGKLPDADRARAIAELVRDLPPQYRDVVETYFKRCAEGKR